MTQKELTDAQKKLLEQFDRVPLEDSARNSILEKIKNISEERVLWVTQNLKEALDGHSEYRLENLRKSGRKVSL